MSSHSDVTILIDTREQVPLDITGYSVERATLPVGDYGIAGFSDWNNPAFIIERKTLDDLVQSLTGGRDRFMRECEKLRGFRFHGLVVEALEAEISFHHYRSNATPQSILQTLAALQVRCGLHILWCGDAERAARCVERLVRQFIRGIEKDYERIGQAADSQLAASLVDTPCAEARA